MRPVWTFSEFSLQSYSRFRERSFFPRCGERWQMRCRLILLISEHPIQKGIRKGGVRHFGYEDEDGRGRTRTEWRILGSWIFMEDAVIWYGWGPNWNYANGFLSLFGSGDSGIHPASYQITSQLTNRLSQHNSLIVTIRQITSYLQFQFHHARCHYCQIFHIL